MRGSVLLVAALAGVGCARREAPSPGPPAASTVAKPTEALCRALPPLTLGGSPGALTLVVVADRAFLLDVVPTPTCPRFALESTRFDAKTLDGPLAIASGDAVVADVDLTSPPCPAAGSLVGPALTRFAQGWATAWAVTHAGRTTVSLRVAPPLTKSPGKWHTLEETTATVSELTLAGGEHLVAAAYVVGDDVHVVRSSGDGPFGAIHVVPGARGPVLAFDGDTLVLTYGQGATRPHVVLGATWPKAAPAPGQPKDLGLRAVAASVAAGAGQVAVAWESVTAKGEHRIHVGASRLGLAAATTRAVELEGDGRRPALARGDGPFYVAYVREGGPPTVVGRALACD